MKRIFTYLLLVFSVLSCREKEVLPAVSPSDIRFSVPKVADTKSVLIEDKSQLKIGDDVLGYSVFAARYIPSETGAITKHQQFMTNIKIQSTDDGSSWDYDSDGAKEGNQHFYWSPGAVHKFFAVYPYYDPTDDTYDLGFEYGINEAEHALQATGKHETGSGTQKLICTGLDNSGKNMTLKTGMTLPAGYVVKDIDKTNITLDKDVVEGYYNEILKYEVVGLKGNDGRIKYYIYDDGKYEHLIVCAAWRSDLELVKKADLSICLSTAPEYVQKECDLVINGNSENLLKVINKIYHSNNVVKTINSFKNKKHI